MLEFEVKDMTCGGCAARIHKALLAADEDAKVETDVAARRVRIAGSLDANSAREAIAGAGYTPIPA